MISQSNNDTVTSKSHVSGTQYSTTTSTVNNVSAVQVVLPWGTRKERLPFPSSILIDTDVKPGEFVLRTLFAEFTVQAEKKTEAVLVEPLEKPLSKLLQRGEDSVFDQLLSALGSAAEHCLPSLLHTLFAWYDRQGVDSGQVYEQRFRSDSSKSKGETAERTEHDYLQEKRDLAIEFIFCLVLIEVLKQFAVHPGHEDLVNQIINLAFRHFRFRESAQTGPNAQNVNIIADLYAEVIGVLAQSRFQSVKKRFTVELKELRSKEPSPITTHSIINLLMGMKFFRVKMVPIEEFEASFQFMQECATYFLEVKDKDIKHALAGLFVEILVPVAASVKNEVNVPCLKNFVEILYSQTLDLCTKKKHSLALFPLVTCLLCVSQKSFFLQNWHYFLAMCLSHLKNRDPKMSRVALESLYRLLWVYMIRIKCESNTATQSRLQSIVNSLFPKGSKAVVPRDTPLNIFVKIIQFISQERLDFAMKEIVFDLLSVGRPIKIILTPERMSIGLRSFLVVADSLQQKEGDPPMPRTVGVLPSGNTLRVKKTFLNKMLTEDTARTIGMYQYYPYVRKTFDDILRALDVQFGRPMMMTTIQNVNKEPDDMITGERKPKIDLFRTCVAAIPRLIPDGMSRQDLVDLLARLTVHMDEELKALAFQSLQNMMQDFPDWRVDVVYGFIQFVLREVNDTFPQLIDNALRMLLQFITNWKNALNAQPQVKPKREAIEQSKTEHLTNVLHQAEAFALVMLCNCRFVPRRLGAHILKEIKMLMKSLALLNKGEETVADVIDRMCPSALEKCLPLLPSHEKTAIASAQTTDLQWLAERNTQAWSSCVPDGSLEGVNKQLNNQSNLGNMDAWCTCMMVFMSQDGVLKHCSLAVAHSWPIIYARITSLFNYLDINPVNDNRASLLRTTTVKKAPNEKDMHLNLWRNYLMFACRVAPPNNSASVCYLSPDLSLSSSPDSIGSERSDNRSPNSGGIYASNLFKQIVPLLRSEQADMRDAVVLGLSHVNQHAVKDLMEELVPYIREAIDRKQENMRRRRRRDILRVQLSRVLEMIAKHGTFGVSPSVLDRDAGSLSTTFVEYIDGARLYLETENDKDASAIVQEIKHHFCGFIHKLIKSFSLENWTNLLGRDLRKNLFFLFGVWSGRFGAPFGIDDKRSRKIQLCPDFEFSSLQAMSAVLCCGPSLDVNFLNDESPVYKWLDNLLGSEEEKLYQLGQETVILLLEFNPDTGSLLDWLVDRCYTGDVQVADGCFSALSAIFSVREYPCDHYIAIINVTLMNTGCPRRSVQETALQLLQLLYQRFFQSFGLSIDVHGDIANSNEEVTLRRKKQLNQSLMFCLDYPCSQLQLSRQLAHLHPELTMPIFSEITCRFQTARSNLRQNLLQYLLPWLYNMELVDPNISQPSSLPQFSRLSEFSGEVRNKDGTVDQKDGWGSGEATEMVLNNLFYITAKFGDEHPTEIENLWAALCSCWPNNLKVIIRYLLIITGLAPHDLLSYAKRVVLYMARTRPERLLDEMMSELQTVETLNCLIERTETPPFFRVTNIRKGSNHSDDGTCSGTHLEGSKGELERGTLHTKRRSTEDGSDRGSLRKDTGSGEASLSSDPSITSLGRIVSNGATLTIGESQNIISTSVEEDNFILLCRYGEEELTKPDTPQPHPLPMPEYGGYYAPLTEFLPESSQPIMGFHRCNLAVLLITDVVSDGISIDWSPHIPLMLHIIFLGMDHTKLLIHEHCKKLLLNLLLIQAKHSDFCGVARILLSNKTIQLGYGLSPFHPVNVLQHNFIEYQKGNGENKIIQQVPSEEHISCSKSLSNFDNKKTETISEGSQVASSLVDSGPSLEDIIKAMIAFLAAKKGQPLWPYEDITSKVWSIRSADQLQVFLQHVVFVFKESVPLARIEERWAQIALQLALSCSSRHYAGRSLQIFRALKVPITSRMLTDILSRLVETVTEQGEDMQGYVTELILTLEAAVETLDSTFKISDIIKEIFNSTPNLTKENNRKSAPHMLVNQGGLGSGHHRSTSYSVSYPGKRIPESPTVETKDLRNRSSTETEIRVKQNSLGRSRSAQSLKMLEEQFSQDDRVSLLAQFFWIAVCLLESDYEHEFLLSLKLLLKVLKKLPLDKGECQEKVEKIYNQMKWSNFPGVHALLLKGCSSAVTFEPTIEVLACLTHFLDVPIIDPSESLGFPFHVMAFLPYMLQNYDEPNAVCIKSAENIAQVCMEKSKKLENLATVMTLYSRRSFSKENFQWTKCVVKYLYDAYSNIFINLMSFLVELIEKTQSVLNQHLLSILYCMLHYMDIHSAAQAINADLLRVILKHVEGPQGKDATKILKLVVTRSSILAAPPAPINMANAAADCVSIASSVSFAESEFGSKRELPGRTMEFSFDVSQTPIVGQIYKAKVTAKEEVITHSKEENPTASPRRSLSHNHSFTENGSLFGWRRPWLSQARTRERFINLLTSCGQRVGLPKSPSVIFSQSSDIMEHQSSMCSSTEEVSGTNNDMSAESKLDECVHSEQQFGIFKDFDFLEYELEGQEAENMDNFNWGVRRRSLTNYESSGETSKPNVRHRTNSSNLSPRKEESSDDEMGSVSPLDDLPPELPNNSVGLVFPPSSLPLLDHNQRPMSPASVSSQSLASDGDVTLSNTSPSFSPLAIAPHVVTQLPADDVEEEWRTHVHLLMADSSGATAVNTYQVLGRLIKETLSKTANITREVCHFFSSSILFRSVGSHFLAFLDILVNQVECPFVFVDIETLNNCLLLERHKLCVLEIQEHWETFSEKWEHVLECMDNLKSIVKLENLGESVAEGTFDENRVDLCRSLYKLHFQLILLLDSFCKLLSQLSSAVTQTQVLDLSEEFTSIKSDLLHAVEDTESDRLSPPGQIEATVMTQQEAENELFEFFRGGMWSKVIKHLHTYRSYFRAAEDDEIEVALSLYCHHRAEERSGIYVMTHTDHDLTDVSRQLMDCSLHLSSLIHGLEHNISPDHGSPDNTTQKTEL